MPIKNNERQLVVLTGLRLRNFRSIKDSGSLRLAPLTLLLGPNSSGKTSVIHALRVARQTADSRDISLPLMLAGDYVDLGTYYDLVYQHDITKQLEMEYSWTESGEIFRPLSIRRRFGHFRQFTLSVEFAYNRKAWQTYPVVQRLTTLDSRLSVTKTRTNRKYSRLHASAGHSEASLIVQTGGKFYDFGSLADVPSVGDIDRELVYWVLYSLPYEFEHQLHRTYFLGPVRGETRRTYTGSAEEPQDVGLRGETTAAAIWWASRRAATRRRILGRVDHWLSRLGVATGIRVLRTQSTDFRLNVIDRETGIESNITDVGFGVSQVLPVVVLACLVPRDATVVIEQPEIHLHPAAQLELGDLFVELSSESKQFIVETHSEHLLRRIQTLVARRKIHPSSVAIYYVYENSEGTQFQELPVTDDGLLENLPSGFFEHSAEEAVQRLKVLKARAAGS